jgi:dTDP-4-amino-4,6-dideoxygalactose transaminase
MMRWHYFDDEDVGACRRVLESGNLCSHSGTEVPAFEDEFAEEMGSPLALGVVNAMAGLHCAVVASGADHGDEVIVDPMVAFAALGALYHHCRPVFCDVERDTHLMDATKLPELVTDKTRAIIVTQLWGLCADMDAINDFAREHDLLVIEDCAHAIYATYNGRYAGTLGDVGVYSFQQSKQMALGDGGMTVMQDENVRRIMHEMTTFETVPARLGWNYRMNELVAAVGRVQLTRARAYVEMCKDVGAMLNEAVEGCEWLVPQAGRSGRENAYHIWTAILEGDEHGITTERFEEACAQEGLSIRLGYIGRPAYAQEPIAQYLDDEPWRPVAEHLMPRLLTIGAGGGQDAHLETAEKLHAVANAF